VRTALVTAFVGISLLLGGSVSADPVVAGDIVQLRLTGDPRFSNGGPFLMDIATGSDFLTFCLEADEYFTLGENLLVGAVSTQAQAGGVNTNSGDPISGTTAFLYSRFRAGDSTFSNGVLLQEAIWYLEGERTTSSASAASLIAVAQTQMAALNWGADFLGDVRVANLYRGTNYGTFAQDMLVIASVPEPATLLLMGLGLLIGTRGRIRRTSNR
jgi:hypothetical protein